MNDRSDFTMTCSELRHDWPERFEGLGGRTPLTRARGRFGIDEVSLKIRSRSLSQ